MYFSSLSNRDLVTALLARGARMLKQTAKLWTLTFRGQTFYVLRNRRAGIMAFHPDVAARFAAAPLAGVCFASSRGLPETYHSGFLGFPARPSRKGVSFRGLPVQVRDQEALGALLNRL
jgi:hypothetical protein